MVSIDDLKILSSEVRVNILKYLEGDPKSFTAIQQEFGLDGGQLGYHLRLLKKFLHQETTKSYFLAQKGHEALDYIRLNPNQIPPSSPSYEEIQQRANALNLREKYLPTVLAPGLGTGSWTLSPLHFAKLSWRILTANRALFLGFLLLALLQSITTVGFFVFYFQTSITIISISNDWLIMVIYMGILSITALIITLPLGLIGAILITAVHITTTNTEFTWVAVCNIVWSRLKPLILGFTLFALPIFLGHVWWGSINWNMMAYFEIGQPIPDTLIQTQYFILGGELIWRAILVVTFLYTPILLTTKADLTTAIAQSIKHIRNNLLPFISLLSLYLVLFNVLTIATQAVLFLPFSVYYPFYGFDLMRIQMWIQINPYAQMISPFLYAFFALTFNIALLLFYHHTTIIQPSNTSTKTPPIPLREK
jgi:hypothetical protein